MNSKNHGSPKGPIKPTPEIGEPKKPSALLDLKATEVTPKDTAAKDVKETKPVAAESSKTADSGPAAAKAEANVKVENSVKPDAAKVEAKPSVPPTSSAQTKPPEPQSAAAKVATSVPPRPQSETSAKPGTSSNVNPPPAAAARAGGIGRVLTHVAAGVAGGFLALLLADTVRPQLGLGGTAASVSELEKRLAAAEQSLRDRPATAAVSSDEINTRLTTLSDRVARVDDIDRTVQQLSETQTKLASDAKAIEERLAQPQASGDADQRVAKLEQMLATLTAAAGAEGTGGRIPQLAAITGKLADLEATLPNKIEELRAAVTSDLDARLAQSAEASEAARSATQRIDKELTTSRADIARLGQRAEAFKASDDRIDQSLRMLQEETGSIRSSVDGLKNELSADMKSVVRTPDLTAAVGAVTTRMGALEQNLQGVVKSEDDRKANAERIVLALELGNLKRALDRGGGYAQELAEVGRVAGGKIDLSVLERYKDQGVPTLPELVNSFRPVAYAVVDAANVPAEASTFDRLLQSAKSVVRVRRTDHRPDDTSVEATVSRMERALADGQLTEVVSEARKIPAPAIDAAEPWLAKVEARAAVDRALASVEEQLKSSLSGQGPAEKRVQ
ncbi:hypothetical protein ACO2I3_02015 [Leptospira interrogans]